MINKEIISIKPHTCKANLNLSIDPNSIPNSIPQKTLNILQEGDSNPFYAVEEILDIRELANGREYTKEFWESYFEVLKNNAIPGARGGHSDPWAWWESSPTDFYVIGHKIEGNSVFLKNYIPPSAQDGSSNERFIKNIKAGLVHFSIVSNVREIVEYNDDNEIVSIKVVESTTGQRNDAVARGTGAMDQKIQTNKQQNITDNNKKEMYIMSDSLYKDIIKNVCNQITNGTINKIDVAKDIGIEIVTEKHVNALKFQEDVEKILGEKSLDKIKELVLNKDQVEKQLVNATREKIMSANFGELKIEVNGEKVDNLLRLAADSLLNKELKTETEINKEIEEIKKHPLVVNASMQNADINSNNNIITPGPGANTKTSFVSQERIEG